MVKNTNTEMVRVSGVNSQSSIDIFSKYLASLALLYDNEAVCDFGEVEKYVGDVIYSKEYNIYYLFEENQFLLRDISDKTVLKKSSLIATPEEMEKYFNKITCSLSGSDSSTKYIQKCKEKAEDFLTNSIRLPLEKFIEYIFEDDDPYPENFEITYNSFFNIPEYFSGYIKPEILSEERLAKLFNLTLLGDYFISNKLNEYLNSLYISELTHRDYDFLFYANFLTIKEIVDNARDKIIVGQFIDQILYDMNQYKDNWFFKETDFIEQSVSIAKQFPKFLEEICDNETEKSLGHILYIEYYYKYHYFGAYGKFKHLLSCKTYGVDWCRNIINLLSKLNDKIQEAKDENEIIYKAWKRIESLFMDDVANFNNFLLEKESNEDNKQIHSSLIGFIQFIRNL